MNSTHMNNEGKSIESQRIKVVAREKEREVGNSIFSIFSILQDEQNPRGGFW